MDDKPSEEDFEIAERVVRWCAEKTEQDEPYAVNAIEEFNNVAAALGDFE